MATCKGTQTDKANHSTRTCNSGMYRCDHCGNIGCGLSGSNVSCTGQGFRGGQCMKCGKFGKKNV